MLIDIKPNDIESAKHSNFLDDLETVHSPRGGHLVGVAMKSGVYVCWQCGQPFVQDDKKLGEVEKLVPGATVPIYIHRGCFNYQPKPFSLIMKGLRTRKAVASIVKRTQSFLGIEPPKQEIVPDPIPRQPIDPDWRFKRRAETAKVDVEPVLEGDGLSGTITGYVARLPELGIEAKASTEDDARIQVREAAVEAFRAREKAEEAAA